MGFACRVSSGIAVSVFAFLEAAFTVFSEFVSSVFKSLITSVVCFVFI